MSDDNLNTYNSSEVVKWYHALDTLTVVERSVFETKKDFVSQSDLLDIGVGGGRTTHYLVDKCKNYIGIDYSRKFVNSVKKIYPKADIRVIDARDLSIFNDNTFDFVNFSFNGIDYVTLNGREKIFNEINRVLKPNGVFFFSTHNKEHPSFNKSSWLNKNNNFFTNLKTFIKLAPYFVKHLNKKKEEFYSDDFAIINDSAHNYNLLTFYTTPNFLIKQLVEFNFSSIELLLKNGNKSINYKFDDWIFVTCKKSVS